MSVPNFDPSVSNPPTSSSSDPQTMQLPASPPADPPDDIQQAAVPFSTPTNFSNIFSQPVLDVPLRTYVNITATAKNESDTALGKNDYYNSLLTKDYYGAVVDRCKLSRKQRDRLKNQYNKWQNLVNDQNTQIGTMNSNISNYNSQVANDNAQITALNNAVAQFNIDGNQATLTAAVNTYNNYFNNPQAQALNAAIAQFGVDKNENALNAALTTYNSYYSSNPGATAYSPIYNAQAAIFNNQVDANNATITQLNASRAKIVPPLPPIATQPYAPTAPQVAAYPAGPYVQPILGTIPSQPAITTLATVSAPPPFNTFTDQNLPKDQKHNKKSIDSSLNLIASIDKDIQYRQFILRGKIPSAQNSYVDKEPPSQSGGSAAASRGMGASVLGAHSSLLQGIVAVAIEAAALTTYAQTQPGQNPVTSPINKANIANFKSDINQSARDLFNRIALQAGVSASVKFESDLKGLRPNGDTQSILIASELAKAVANVSQPGSEGIVNSIASELVTGSELFKNATPEVQASVTADIAAFLQNAVAQFALQNVASSLNAPGLISQVNGLAAPNIASTLKPPTTVDNLNGLLAQKGVQLQELKNAVIDNIIKTGEVPRRQAVDVVSKAVDTTATQVPFNSVTDFLKALQNNIATGPSALSISSEELTNALNNSAVFINNQLPLPFVTGNELDRVSASNFINSDNLAQSIDSSNILQGSIISTSILQDSIKSANENAASSSVRDVRDSVISDLIQKGNNVDDTLNVGNNLAQTIVDQDVNQGQIKAVTINSANLQASIQNSLIQKGIVSSDASKVAIDIAKQFGENIQEIHLADISAALQQELLNNNIQSATLNTQTIASDAIKAATDPGRPGAQQLTGIGADSILTQSQLAETLVNYATGQLSKTLPTERAANIANELVVTLVGKEATTNLDDLQRLNTPSSILRLVSDSVNHIQQTNNQKVSDGLQDDFRSRMSPNMDTFALSLEIMDPANHYVRSKFEGMSTDKSFRSSIDIAA